MLPSVTLAGQLRGGGPTKSFSFTGRTFSGFAQCKQDGAALLALAARSIAIVSLWLNALAIALVINEQTGLSLDPSD